MPSDRETQELLEDAAGAYCEGRFDDAFPVYLRFAAVGNVEAIRGLAEMYLRGEGVPADVDEGMSLLRRAAFLGDAGAAYNLGALYRSGAYGVRHDPENSKRFFLLAKELGCELPVDNFV